MGLAGEVVWGGYWERVDGSGSGVGGGGLEGEKGEWIRDQYLRPGSVMRERWDGGAGIEWIGCFGDRSSWMC